MSETTLKPFHPEPKRIWVEALRGDRFTQGTGAFTCVVNTEFAEVPIVEHCCLAVATAVAIEHGVKTVRAVTDGTGQVTAYEKLMVYDFDQDCWVGTDDDGLAENLAAHVEWDGEASPHDNYRPSEERVLYRWVEEEESLPLGVQTWLGAESSDPVISDVANAMQTGGLNAISANDAEQWSYAEIADSIERER